MLERRGRAARAARAALAAAALLALAGCGRDDLENQPRPPAPAEVGVEISNRQVVVSPSDLGAGLVNFTVANLSDRPATLTIDGPTVAETDPIPAGGNVQLKASMETGSYLAIAEGPPRAEPFPIEVGPERPSSEGELLLP